MKKEIIKLIKKFARERIPASTLRGKVVPSKKKKLMEKAIFEAESQIEKNN